MSVRLWQAVMAASVAVAPVAVSAQSAATDGPSPAVIAMREQWLNPAINSFTFRDTDKVFESRAVPRSGPVWPLATGPALAMPAHASGGQTMPYGRLGGPHLHQRPAGDEGWQDRLRRLPQQVGCGDALHLVLDGQDDHRAARRHRAG
jgi:hypothetical protein